MFALVLNAYHGDTSPCYFKDNIILAVAKKVKFSRIKHVVGSLINAINYCPDTARTSIDQVDYIVINRNPKQKIIKKVLFASTKLSNLNFIKNRFENLKKINSIKKEFENYFKVEFKSEIHNINHHTFQIVGHY